MASAVGSSSSTNRSHAVKSSPALGAAANTGGNTLTVIFATSTANWNLACFASPAIEARAFVGELWWEIGLSVRTSCVAGIAICKGTSQSSLYNVHLNTLVDLQSVSSDFLGWRIWVGIHWFSGHSDFTKPTDFKE